MVEGLSRKGVKRKGSSLDQSAIAKALEAEGFGKVHSTKKLIEYRRGNESIYMKASGTDRPLIIHGRHAPNVAALSSIPGVERAKPASVAYHNSNMRSFDLRQNTGKKPTRYGFDFGFRNAGALKAFLSTL
jgi:hypothetical protein